jgi:hypothetical protein
MQRKCLTLAPTLAREPAGHAEDALVKGESPAKQAKETALRRGPFLGYYREERYVLLSVGGSRYQAPSGRLNRVEAVSAKCAEPNPTKKTVATWSPAIPATTPTAIVAAASV